MGPSFASKNEEFCCGWLWESSSNLKTPSPHQQQYIVETPPSSEHKRLSESPIPPTHHYSPVLAPASRKDAKDDDDDDDGPLTVMMPNEFRSNLHRGDEGDDDDQCVSDAEAKELADRIVSMNEHKADLEPPPSKYVECHPVLCAASLRGGWILVNILPQHSHVVLASEAHLSS